MDARELDDFRSRPLAMRLSDEELSLIRWIGTRLSRVLLGRYEDVPTSTRTDELGILVNMVARVARELKIGHERDEAQRRELEARVHELEAARAEQARLLETVRELSSPILAVHDGVLLVPIAGVLDESRLIVAEERVLARVAREGAKAVILDITGASSIDPGVSAGLVRIARAVSLLGAHVFLCGVSAAAARTAVEQGLDFAPARIKSHLASAITAAIAETGRAPTRGR